MKSAICSIARNENDYLDEWVTYHLNIGFDHIFIYDNNNPDDFSLPQFIEQSIWKDKVTVIDYRGATKAQLTAYNDCYIRQGQSFDWIAFIDIDEFITWGNESRYRSINNYLGSIRQFNVVAINWMFYGDNGKACLEPGGLIQRFPNPIVGSEQNQHVKLILKTRQSLLFTINPHCVEGNARRCDDCQKQITENSPFKEPSFKQLYIRHYGTKTIEEFIKNKMLRGAADQYTNPYTLELFYRDNQPNKEKKKIEKQLLRYHKEVKKPLVSVIIPNYNHKPYLKQRIDSILSQSFSNFEVIILDDNSSDNSQSLLLSYKDNPHVSHIILNTQNSGSPFAQWEKGIRLAKGKYIWIAESDDYASPDFLMATVREMEQHPEAQLCITGSYIVDGSNCPVYTDEFDHWEEDGKAYVFPSDEYLVSRMLDQNTVYNASMVLFRKQNCLQGISPRYRTMHYCGDWLFWVEQIRKGAIIEIHQKLNYFRKHGNNTTNKGATEGNSLPEIAFIRNIFYTQIMHDKKEILKSKHDYYRCVKRYKVSSSKRTRELLSLIAKEGNIKYRHYLYWRFHFIGSRIRQKLATAYIFFRKHNSQ